MSTSTPICMPYQVCEATAASWLRGLCSGITSSVLSSSHLIYLTSLVLCKRPGPIPAGTTFSFLCVTTVLREKPNTQYVLKLMMKNMVWVSQA